MAVATWELPPGPRTSPARQAVAAGMRRPLGLLEEAAGAQFGDTFTCAWLGRRHSLMLLDHGGDRRS